MGKEKVNNLPLPPEPGIWLIKMKNGDAYVVEPRQEYDNVITCVDVNGRFGVITKDQISTMWQIGETWDEMHKE